MKNLLFSLFLALCGFHTLPAQALLGRKVNLGSEYTMLHMEPLAKEGFALVGTSQNAEIIGKYTDWEIIFFDVNLQPQAEPMKLKLSFDGLVADMQHAGDYLYILFNERGSIGFGKKTREILRVNIKTKEMQRLHKEVKGGGILNPQIAISNEDIYLGHLFRKNILIEKINFNDRTQESTKLKTTDKFLFRGTFDLKLNFDNQDNASITTASSLLEIRSGNIPKGTMTQPAENIPDMRNLYGFPLDGGDFFYMGNYRSSKKNNGYFVLRKSESGIVYQNPIELEELKALNALIAKHARRNKDEKKVSYYLGKKSITRHKPVQYTPDGNLLLAHEIIIIVEQGYDFLAQHIALVFMEIDPDSGELLWHQAALVNGYDPLFQKHDGFEKRHFAQYFWDRETGEITVFAKDVGDDLLITSLNLNDPNHQKLTGLSLRETRKDNAKKKTDMSNDIQLLKWHDQKLLLLGFEKTSVAKTEFFVQEIMVAR